MKFSEQRNSLLNISVILILWIIAWILVNPFHDFPLNDDWSYSYSVKMLVDEGSYVLTDWLASPLLTQILWGALFCLPFGFSFEALTLSTLVLALVGIVVSYLLIHMFTKDSTVSLVATLFIAFNPLFFSLSSTFMMDVPFYSLFIVAFYLFTKHVKDHMNSYWIWGTVVIVAGMLLRQIAVVIPLSFLVYSFLQRSDNRKRLLSRYLITTILVFAVYFIYNRIIANLGILPDSYRSFSDILTTGPEELAWRIFVRIGTMLNEAGLCLFPLILIWFISSAKTLLKYWKQIIIPFIILLMPMIRTFNSLPAGNIIIDFGIGPLTTADMYIHEMANHPFSLPWIWLIIKPIAFTGGMMLLVLLIFRVYDTFFRGLNNIKSSENPERLISFFIIIFTMGTILINFTHFDRYLIPLLAPTLLFIQPGKIYKFRPINTRIYILIFTGLLAYFSIAATKNYLGWNALRWAAARELMEEGIPYDKIDGGHEFNGWHGKEITSFGKWNTSESDYLISFNSIEGFELVKTLRERNYIKMNEYEMYVLKREDSGR